MPDRKTVHLAISMPDPGEHCYCTEQSEDCRFYDAEWVSCQLGFPVQQTTDDDGISMVARPQECIAAVVTHG